MLNHVRLIAVPQSADGLRHAISDVHRRYMRLVSFGALLSPVAGVSQFVEDLARCGFLRLGVCRF
jgi:hypothetical protein